MKDYTADAETLFREFAARHSFEIEKLDEPNVELMMRLPPQEGLSFELTLGLQNKDELTIEFAGFSSFFFPFEETRAVVEKALGAIASGNARLAIHRQLGIVITRALEYHTNGDWQVIYTAYSWFRLPFIGAKVSYLYNEGARTHRKAPS
ncbi:MAG TPA: hypothetical protein VGC25_05405, partial [Alphaproteobacteria bacterium]